MTTDASTTAIGGVVAQLDDDNKEQSISFCSRALKGAETQYSTIELEALAIKFTLQRHKYILLGQPITVRTDHLPLKYLYEH